MNDINVQNSTSSQAILEEIARRLFQLPTELQKVASYVLEKPNEVGVDSARGLARAAGVKPNSVVRFARELGFGGYDDLRRVFKDEMRQGPTLFHDRARGLQERTEKTGPETIFADMASSAIGNVESSFASTNAAAMQAAARTICLARTTYVLGVGINHTIASNFAYLADMAVGDTIAVPRGGNLAIDDVARAGPQDVLIAMTFKPYRVEVVEAVEFARARDVAVIGISDSPASPIVVGSDHSFVVHTDSPQFFTSTSSTLALLESLMGFVVAEAGDDVVSNIRQFIDRRHELGLYKDDPISG